MKKLYYIFSLILASMFLMTSCQDDDHELGTLLNKSQIDFDVTQEYSIDEGGNTVILRSKTDNIVPMWDFGTGRSNRAVDTVRFPFKGEYTIKFSALTAGGIVEMDPVTIEVTEDNLNYVNDPLWTALTGGVGNEKSWVLDTEAKLFNGPITFLNPDNLDEVWWDPGLGDVYPNVMAEGDYGVMTFNLKGGPYFHAIKPMEEGIEENSTFSLNVDSKILSINDASILRGYKPDKNGLTGISDWSNYTVFALDENTLRLGVIRDKDVDGEGPAMLVYNFISKEYADNYVPGFTPAPDFDHGDQLQILAGNSTTTWKLSTETPFNWTNLAGGYLYKWYSPSDYPDSIGYSASSATNIENVRLTFTRTGDVILKQNDGSTEQGVFSIDEGKNLVSFDGIRPSIYMSGELNPEKGYFAETTDYFEDEEGNKITGENQWKIVKVKRFAGVVTDIWFGKRDVKKPEYMVYHFVLDADVPNFTREVTRLLAGGVVGESSRTFKIDTNWPVDWTNPLGEGWTVAGTQDDWYWNENIANSVIDQRVTFSQVNGVLTMTKRDEQGNTSSSPVTIDAVNKTIAIPNTNIIQFGGDSWLPTGGPEYNWIKGEYGNGTSTGFWIGLPNNDENTEYVAYHYILAE